MTGTEERLLKGSRADHSSRFLRVGLSPERVLSCQQEQKIKPRRLSENRSSNPFPPRKQRKKRVDHAIVIFDINKAAPLSATHRQITAIGKKCVSSAIGRQKGRLLSLQKHQVVSLLCTRRSPTTALVCSRLSGRGVLSALVRARTKRGASVPVAEQRPSWGQ